MAIVRTMPGVLVALALGSVAAGLAEAAILAILAQAALHLVNGKSHIQFSAGPIHNPTIDSLLLMGVALAVIRLVLGLVISYLPAVIFERTQTTLRSDLFEAFAAASWDVQSRDREGHFQDLVTDQVAMASEGYPTAAQLVSSALAFLVLIGSSVAVNPIAAVGIIVVAGALAVLLRPLGGLGRNHAEELSHERLAYATGVNEAVRLAEEAHVFGAHERQQQQLDASIDRMRAPMRATWWFISMVSMVYQALIYLLLVLGLVILHALGSGHVASLGVIVLLLVRSGAYGQQVQSSIQRLRQIQPFMDRVQAAEDAYRGSVREFGTTHLEALRSIRFDHVSFSYADARPALSDLGFEVGAGETIGVIGPSGAGKSTLVSILLGLREAESGSYLVNGVPAEDYLREDWRRHFAYVPQDPRLLHASVSDNIRFYRDISDAAVQRAAELAGIHDDIMSWNGGYDAVIGPRADAISGGQQQRICLARSLATEPSVLVLDEPTSALDPVAEQRIQRSLIALKDRLTLFIVAHRMSTLDICERVMVIVDGRLQGFAPLDELQDTNPYYQAALSTVTRVGS